MPTNRGSTKLANCSFAIINRFIFTFQSIILNFCNVGLHSTKLMLSALVKLTNFAEPCWNGDIHLEQDNGISIADRSKIENIHEVNQPRGFLVLGQAQSYSPSPAVPFAPRGTLPIRQSSEAINAIRFFYQHCSTKTIIQQFKNIHCRSIPYLYYQCLISNTICNTDME